MPGVQQPIAEDYIAGSPYLATAPTASQALHIRSWVSDASLMLCCFMGKMNGSHGNLVPYCVVNASTDLSRVYGVKKTECSLFLCHKGRSLDLPTIALAQVCTGS